MQFKAKRWRGGNNLSTYIPFTIKIPTADTEPFKSNMGVRFILFLQYLSPQRYWKFYFQLSVLILVLILFYVQHDPENGNSRNFLSYNFVIDIIGFCYYKLYSTLKRIEFSLISTVYSLYQLNFCSVYKHRLSYDQLMFVYLLWKNAVIWAFRAWMF